MDNRYNNIDEQEVISHLAPVPFDNNVKVGLSYRFNSYSGGKFNFQLFEGQTGLTATIKQIQKMRNAVPAEEVVVLPQEVAVSYDSNNKRLGGVKFTKEYMTVFNYDDVKEWKAFMADKKTGDAYSFNAISAFEADYKSRDTYKDLCETLKAAKTNLDVNPNNQTIQAAHEEAKNKVDDFENDKWRSWLQLQFAKMETFHQTVRAAKAEHDHRRPGMYDTMIADLKRERMDAIRKDKCCLLGYLECLCRKAVGGEDGIWWCTLWACIRTIWFFALFVVGPLAICYFLPGKFKPMGNDALDCVDSILALCGMHPLGIKFAMEEDDPTGDGALALNRY